MGKTMKSTHYLILLISICIVVLIFLTNCYDDELVKLVPRVYSKNDDLAACGEVASFDGFNNVIGAPDGCELVPNFVHFVHFRRRSFNFGATVCVLAALKNQKPDRILIHTDVPRFKGRYWRVLMDTPGFKERLILVRRSFPEEIFARRTNSHKILHASDITRIRALMEYGGIYLDTDACVLKNLDEFRKFEMVVAWDGNTSLSTHVMIAHKGARFLKEYLDTYRTDYDPRKTHYNSADFPTQEILRKKPYLVHRVEKLFGDKLMYKKMYLEYFPAWRDYYVINTRFHEVSSLRKEVIEKFGTLGGFWNGINETNIMKYPVTYRELVRSVWNQDLEEKT